jgi:hypothetical protein
MKKELSSEEEYELFLELLNSYINYGTKDVKNSIEMKIKKISDQ